jgi:hypothetical protein
VLSVFPVLFEEPPPFDRLLTICKTMKRKYSTLDPHDYYIILNESLNIKVKSEISVSTDQSIYQWCLRDVSIPCGTVMPPN